MAKKVITLLLLAAVAFAVIIYFQGKEAAGPAAGITPPVASGNIDDAVASLLSEIADEQLTLDETVADEALFFSDSQEVGAFSQSVDENEY